MSQQLQYEQRAFADGEMRRLRSLAVQEPPRHDCQLRSEILEARAKLARLDAAASVKAPVEPNPMMFELVPEAIKAPQPINAASLARNLVAMVLHAGTRPASEVIASAQGAKISLRTTQRATEQLGVVKAKTPDGWTWTLPEAVAR